MVLLGKVLNEHRENSMALAFEVWMSKVNGHMIQLCGMSADDLPDWGYWDAWKDGMGWGAAARAAIKNAREDY